MKVREALEKYLSHEAVEEARKRRFKQIGTAVHPAYACDDGLCAVAVMLRHDNYDVGTHPRVGVALAMIREKHPTISYPQTLQLALYLITTANDRGMLQSGGFLGELLERECDDDTRDWLHETIDLEHGNVASA